MRCDLCRSQAVIHVTVARERTCADEKHLCEKHGQEFADAAPHPASPTPSSPPTGTVPFDIDMLVMSEITDSHLVYLRELNGERRFWLMIGLHEITALERILRQLAPPRPLTYDAWVHTIHALGAKLQDVVISHLSSHTYHGRLRISRENGPLVEVDVRPSDALNLAVLGGVSILVAEEILAGNR
jgi:bifunctional DNase/RNase